MKTFKETDNLSDMRAGDILELEDRTRHEAVHDNRTGADWMESCKDCSMLIIYTDGAGCRAETSNSHPKCNGHFHFKQIKP